MKKVLPIPRQRQIFADDCGADALCCLLAATGHDVREDKILALAGTSIDGTEIGGVLMVCAYYHVQVNHGRMVQTRLRWAIDNGHPVLITLQAYRDDPNANYGEDVDDGHWVIVKGYEALDSDLRVVTRWILDDPSSWTDMHILPNELEVRWHDADAENKRVEHWGCVILSPITYDPIACPHMD